MRCRRTHLPSAQQVSKSKRQAFGTSGECDGHCGDAQRRVGRWLHRRRGGWGRPLFGWLVNGDVELVEGGTLKVSQASAEYVRPMFAGIGAMVVGRHLFDITNGREGSPPAGEHVIVVSHRPGPMGGDLRALTPFTPDRRHRTISSTMWHR